MKTLTSRHGHRWALPSCLLAFLLAASLVEVHPAAVWKPQAGTSWQIQFFVANFTGIIKQKPSVMDIDVDNYQDLTRQIGELGFKRSDFKVVCYFSTGTMEPFRRATDKKLRGIDWAAIENSLGKSELYAGALNPPFQSEKWLNIASDKVRAVLVEAMNNRTKYAAKLGCNGVDFDNVDAYSNRPKVTKKVTKAHALQYNMELVNYAHSLGLAVGLKNGLHLLSMSFPDGQKVAETYDFFINERCHEYDDCDWYNVVPATSAVFGIEYCDYPGSTNNSMDPTCFCPLANANPRFSFIFKATNLADPGLSCRTLCKQQGSCKAPASGNPRLCLTAPGGNCVKYGIKA